MKHFNYLLLSTVVTIITSTGCSNSDKNYNANSVSQTVTKDYTAEQERLLADGWYFPKSKPSGELSKEYGVKSRYGQHDNYFDIEVGKGYDVALKLIDAKTEKCIRYIYIPESTTVNIQMVPQGSYYLKFSYGNDWMEFDNGDGTISGKFTSNVIYDRSSDVFNFGRKNSSQLANYLLRININDSQLHNNFETIAIPESEFFN